jgi:hypothetical protein
MKAGAPEFYRPNVGLMLIGAERRIFVGRRLNQPDAWQMPQGGVDKARRRSKRPVRELREEVGTAKALLLRETRDWVAYECREDLRPAALEGPLARPGAEMVRAGLHRPRQRHRPRTRTTASSSMALGAGARIAVADRAVEAAGLRRLC